ncbi:PQ-loop domain-containing transporter [Legionella saoudiensis]|uniref:PQ-loop domain-containing transporter n=1 Tax=Legionella saoudiensis TaxID=1750561 RepID=UPI000731D106|nr:PQ-loop domain-containing transporter [Legionella saoudiensis]
MDFTKLFINFGFSISLIINALLFIPQIVSIWRHQSVQGVSLLTFAGFNVIQFFTVCHGLIEGDHLLAAGYILSLITCGAVTFLIIYFRYTKKIKEHRHA